MVFHGPSLKKLRFMSLKSLPYMCLQGEGEERGAPEKMGWGEKEEKGREKKKGGERTTFLEEEPVGPVPRSAAICSVARPTHQGASAGEDQ